MATMPNDYVSPPLPTKDEVIAIRTSDRGAFKRCRRYWDWTSPIRKNLKPRVDIHGLNLNLWMGTGIHRCLEEYYNPALRRDPEEVWINWYELQWNGGICTEEELVYNPDPFPKQLADGKYKVRGLRDIMPEPNPEEFEELRDLGRGMMNFYKLYAEEHDTFDVIAVEHDFSVPIPIPPSCSLENLPEKADFYTIDSVPGVLFLQWGGKPVHALGRMDMIEYDHEAKQYGLTDHKTAIDITEQYFLKLEKDPQCNSYMWAAELEALVHDLPYKRIDYVRYNAVRKAYPKPPTITSRGLPSLNRQTESTTSGMFWQVIEECNLKAWFQVNEKAQTYAQYLLDVGDEQFVKRDFVRRNRHEVAATGEATFYEALDMLNNPAVYPNPNSTWQCLRCTFRAPCLAKDDGGDYESLLENNYEGARDR